MLHKPRLLASLIAIAAGLLLILPQNPAFAGIYKWVDEQGGVHYGERPVSNSAEKLNIRTDNVTQTRKIPLKSEEELAEEEKKKKAAEEKKASEPQISAKDKRRYCQQARHDLEVISSRGRLREINKKGEYIYLKEEQRQKRIKQTQKDIQKYCR